MTPPRLDPGSLADELDRVLARDPETPTTPSDDPLIGAALLLSRAPRPTLAPEASARIRGAILAAQAAPQFATSARGQRHILWSIRPRPNWAAALLVLLLAGTIFAAQFAARVFNPAVETLPPSTRIVTQPPEVTTSPPAAAPSSGSTHPPPSLAFVPPPEVLLVSPTALPTAVPQTALPVSTLPVTIIIEGPVQLIDGNIIVIFGISIVLSPTDPLLRAIRVGDVLHVEGSADGDDNTIIVAVRAVIVDVEVNINPADGEVWRDPGNCSNSPPPWAPAHGWRRRCEGSTSSGNLGGQGMGMGD